MNNANMVKTPLPRVHILHRSDLRLLRDALGQTDIRTGGQTDGQTDGPKCNTLAFPSGARVKIAIFTGMKGDTGIFGHIMEYKYIKSRLCLNINRKL